MSEGQAADRMHAAPTRVGAVDARFALAALLVIVAAGLGGASRENPLRLAVVELCALPLVALAVRRAMSGKVGRTDAAGFALALLAMIIAVPLLQLIPLPPGVWTAAPGQAARAEALRLARLPTPWLPLSLSPGDTARAVLALIPPAAMLVATLRLDASERRRLAWLWIVLAVAGLALGLAQVAAPGGGPAYPYRTTNVGSLVGLFANRNHEAGFLLALLPFAAALAMSAGPGEPRRTGPRGRDGAPWMAWLFILVSIVALGVIRSRAGLILAAPATLAAISVAWRGRDWRVGGRPMAAIAAAIGPAALAVALFGLDPILVRFDGHAPAEFRFEAWPQVIAAARSFLPLGSGLGSFDRVFEAVEPLSLVGPTYFNHAHNDFLELWLETGWVGAAILALFLAWFIPAAWRAWRSGVPLAQAASAAVMLLMAQSVVDYPLRTETLAILFAFCCGVLAAPGRPGP
jgi:O-antigen ligase